MPFKNLLKISCFIALCFFVMPVMAQNVSSDTLHTGATSTSFGYGLQRKKDVTGAVATLTPENFNQGAIFNPVDQLAGKIAGLTITESGGDPNQIASIHLRGQSSLLGSLSPLFVVDGVILDDAAQFQNIPPDDIASYVVLKDASAAAIYGSRGANGVIIVTTKKGTAGHPVISYDGLVGSSVQSKYIDLLTPNEYRAAIGASALGIYDKGANTDWQRAISRTAFQQRHYVSVSGGTHTFNYIASANYQNQQGIILNNGKEQLGLRFSGELKAIGDKLDIKAGVQNVNTTRKYTDYSIFSYMYNSPPTYPVKNPDGSYFAYTDFNLANPIEHLNQEVLGAKDNLTLVSGSADYSITHDLKIGVLGSASLNKVQSNGYIPSFPLEGNVAQSGTANENRHAYNGNIHINYDKTFGKSTLNLLAGYEYNDHSYNMDYSSGPANATSTGSSKVEYKLRSFIARAAYNYDDRFYATATLREDGFSKLVPNNQTGSFPSLSLAYRFKKDLFANADWISDIKLRGGYGVTGNSTDQNGNPLLRWEERDGRNVGLDFSLFNGRISGDVNYFNDLSKNLLVAYSAPPPFVTNTLLVNFGSLVNKGLEVSLSGRIISGHKLNWTANGQITFITTTLTNLSGQYSYNGQSYTLSASQIPVAYAQGRGLSSNPISFLKTGYSPYVFYLPHFTGVDAQGNQTFDGKTIAQNSNPAGYYIDPSPAFNYSITNSFDYGNWNLNFALRGVYGQKIFNNTLLDVETITRLPVNNVTKEALTNGIKDAPVASDKWLEDASFLRLDNATLGYSFKNVGFASTLRVFVSGNNLFVITKYKGLDPEIKTESGTGGNILFGQNLNGSANQAYIDANYGGQAYYPSARTFSLGVNVALK
jgi:iron complex outermembrane receptor protein